MDIQKNSIEDEAVAVDIADTAHSDDTLEIQLSDGSTVELTSEKKNGRSIQISKKAVLVGVAVVFALFIIAYVMTFVLDKGAYLRTEDGSIIPGTYAANPELEGITWWQFLLAPFMVLLPSTAGSGTLWGLIALLVVLGAVFTALDSTGVLVYLIEYLNHRFSNKKYLLLFILPFAFMFLGSTAGMYEELIPLVPVVILLSYALGWDALVGLAMSLIAACFGFASGVVNFFTVGVAQTLGNIPMYSGIGLRLLAFAVTYIVLMLFLFPYAKKIEKNPQKSIVYKADCIRRAEFSFEKNLFVPEPGKAKALVWFSAWLIVIVALAVISIFWVTLAEYMLYILVAAYVVIGIGACLFCGMRGKALVKLLLKGMVTLLPAVAMILFAGGIRYIIEKGAVMDTILYMFTNLLSGSNSFSVVLMLLLIIIVFEMFIPSATGKAFLLMPMIYGICAETGINGQVAVLAFTFADGFTNVFLPTNAGLLLVLGMTTVDYGKWARWTFKYVAALIAVCIAILALAHFVVYA